MVRDGFRFFLLPHVRDQLAMEIRAQFEAFSKTGLQLDHVNTHKHFHLHPTVLSLILDIGRDYGMRAMRLPYEAHAPVWIKPWMTRVRSTLKRAGIAHNDYVVGIAQTGQMDEAALLATIAHLPDGVGEIYCHPATPGEGALSAACAPTGMPMNSRRCCRRVSHRRCARQARCAVASSMCFRAALSAHEMAAMAWAARRHRDIDCDDAARACRRCDSSDRAGRFCAAVADSPSRAALAAGCACMAASADRRATLRFLWWVATVREAVSRLLPVASIGGEFVGIRLALWRVPEGSSVSASVIVEVLVTIAVQYAFSALGVVLTVESAARADSWLPIALALLLSLPLPAAAIVLARRGRPVQCDRARREAFCSAMAASAVAAHRRQTARCDINALMVRTGLLVRAFLWQFAGYASGALETYFALAMLGHPVSVGGALAIEAITQAVRHAAFFRAVRARRAGSRVVLLAQIFGVSREAALSLALVKRMREVIFGCLALASWQCAELFRRWGENKSKEREPAVGAHRCRRLQWRLKVIARL